MSGRAGAQPPPRLALPGTGKGALALDPLTGLPATIEPPQGCGLAPVRLSSKLTLHLGGSEVRGLAGGLDYPGSEPTSGPSAARVVQAGGDEAAGLVVHGMIGGWSLTQRYEAVAQLPRLRWSLELGRDLDDGRPLRGLELVIDLDLGELDDWSLHAPGNRVLPGVCLGELAGELWISPAAGSLGSPGLVVLEHRTRPLCLVLWPLSRTEIGSVRLQPGERGVALAVSTGLAGDPAPGEQLSWSGCNLDVVAAPWGEVRGHVRGGLASLGVGSPLTTPAWVRASAIYEVQVGRSVFSGGWSYEPYPQLEDVTADLDRIAALGFDTIQLMPRQPYPSYNVHDYDDTTTTYGGDESLHRLVEQCHDRGLRVVLDIVLHGVLDRRSVRAALAEVSASGILDQPAPEVGDVFADTAESRAALTRAWCQHIVDFAPYWLEGSPEVHPLTVEHPGWFCRDSAGELTGIYTHAFDLADAGWQRWFCGRALELVERFSIDGFRLDAPTYNNFANWSPERRRRASASTLGCVGLFEQLRRVLKAGHPELLLFTEPSGVVLRESMDLNYNYDELWLVPALTAQGHGPASVSDGAGLAAWLDERDATLPAAALTAHHLDSHDTFWWPAPGRKWRREQIGLRAARALTWCLAFCGGPYFVFAGGEVGMEEDLRRTLELRRRRPELGAGAADHRGVSVDGGAVYAVVRHHGPDATLVLVNLSEHAVEAGCRLDKGWRVDRAVDYYPTAPADAAPVRVPHDGSTVVELAPYGIALVELAR